MRLKHLSRLALAAAVPAFAGQQGQEAFGPQSPIAIRNAQVLNIRSGQVVRS